MNATTSRISWMKCAAAPTKKRAADTCTRPAKPGVCSCLRAGAQGAQVIIAPPTTPKMPASAEAVPNQIYGVARNV